MLAYNKIKQNKMKGQAIDEEKIICSTSVNQKSVSRICSKKPFFSSK